MNAGFQEMTGPSEASGSAKPLFSVQPDGGMTKSAMKKAAKHVRLPLDQNTARFDVLTIYRHDPKQPNLNVDSRKRLDEKNERQLCPRDMQLEHCRRRIGRFSTNVGRHKVGRKER